MKSKSWYSDDAVLELCEVNVYGCPVGKYGEGNCDSDCTTCTNYGYTCKPSSNMCDICAPGYYSQSCVPCPVNCKDNFCASDSGACIECSPGFSGTYCRCPLNCKDASCPLPTGYCTECFDSFYGDRCNLTCPSNCLTNVCARSNGQCTACKPGFFGTHCRCPANCRDQSCPGDYCNECDIGYYGIRCDLVCPNNCDNMGCNRTSGECIACTPGFSGTYCRCPANCRDETCPADTGYCNDCNDGYYGQFCTPCPDSCRNNACNKTSGYCLECNDGYFNIHCNQSCPVNCKGRICNIDSAECTECEPGFHGSLCNQTCPTNCKNNICIMQDGRCLEIEALTSDPDSQIGTHAGVGVGTAVLIIVVIVLVVVVLRRRKSQSKESTTSQFDDDSDIRTLSQPPKQQRLDSHAVSQRQTPPANDDRIAYMNVGDVGNMEQVAYSNVKAMNGDSIEDIRAMIPKKMKNGQEVFKNEFKVLPWGAVHPHLEGAKPANKAKNRFKTTFPYDHSRVILNKIGNDPDSTYINANFIDSVDADNVYVACQGPKEKTVNDFWRMIWQLNTGKIVMVTNLVEGGHVKCYQYWPNEGSPLDTRHFNITLDRERTYAFYVIREISLSKKTTKEERQVHQFHFTAWPDHGTPNNIELVLFHRRVTSCVTHLTGQMVVHCSAGLGRTGTFIGLDALSKAERESGRVDILEYIRTMRKDRMNMIQTHEQYIALHELLVEAADLSNTLISRMKFPDALQNILPAGKPTNQTKLRIEFGKLQTLIPIYNSDSYTAGMMAKNKDKNRTMSNIAVDMFRAFLRSQGRGRTDYINAVLLQSHRSKTGYLITQFPLKDTIDDFWTLVVDYNCENIVVLGTPSEVSNLLTLQLC
ncbi:receptor-type tyrosine-protein phosphatase alpha-like [Ylistrum balloti]|uniref:receptor-type tyrosine-protein phosphatase alpha-like n=1 Tax=Ylistrum balloti TaxID=509963 RepID=UPI002905D21C|nr:receptor-type tyrosine-protein phosphatase alpha-like [Ylistrum balloti]